MTRFWNFSMVNWRDYMSDRNTIMRLIALGWNLVPVKRADHTRVRAVEIRRNGIWIRFPTGRIYSYPIAARDMTLPVRVYSDNLPQDEDLILQPPSAPLPPEWDIIQRSGLTHEAFVTEVRNGLPTSIP